MTDSKTATERLRELLEERGVEWKNVGGTTSADGMTEWLVDGMTCKAVNRVTFGIEHLALFIPILTPEQAIAVTLGNAERTCKIESSYYYDDYDLYEFEFSCGHSVNMYDKEPTSYCPICGCKVVGE